MLLRFEHRFCHIAALAGKPAATAAVFWVGTEGGSVMFLLYVRKFGRIGGLLLRNRPEDAGIRREWGGRFGFAYRRLAGMFFRMRYFSDGLLGRLKGSDIRPTVFRQSVHEGMKLYPLFGDMVSDGL
jgi:hypothetical protein